MAKKKLTKKLITSSIEKRDVASLRLLFSQYPLIDIAETVNHIDDAKELLFIMKTCNSDDTAELFSYLLQEQQEKLLHLFSDKEVVHLLNNSYADDITDMMMDMPANLVTRILKVADPSIRDEINHLLNYKPSSAGSLMTTEYMTISQTSTITDALEKIQTTGKDKETIYTSFVIDNKRKVLGALYIEDVLFNQGKTPVIEVMNKDYIACKVHTDQEEAAQLMKRYNLSVLPVLNESDHLVGIITLDDVVDVIEKEASEDMLKMAKIIPLEESYMQSSVLALAKKSLPWLMLLLVLGALSGFILNQFEDAFRTVAILAAFIPMLMDTGGNAGNQSATLITRGIALKEIQVKDFKTVFGKEFKVALIVGLGVGIFAFVWISFIMAIGFLAYDTPSLNWTLPWFLEIFRISGVVSLTLMLGIIIAKVVGSVLPLLAVVLKKDPAVMASPFVTTIVDVTALIIYFILANSLFNLF
jgi:magnesium transporter